MTQHFIVHNDAEETPVISSHNRKYNRYTSMFMYLATECAAGKTYFPCITPTSDMTESGRITTSKRGLKIVLIEGNGVF